MMNEDRLVFIKNLLKSVPRGPWHYYCGDDFDHWQIWSPTDGITMVQDDSGVLPDTDFINFVLQARGIIEELLLEVEKK